MKAILCFVALLVLVGANGPSYYPRYPSYPTYKRPVEDYSVPANYEFKYGVQDDYSGQDFKHSEHRDGVKTTGSYEVALPDGRIQIVTYTADENGFVADVAYQGDVQYPKTYSPPSPNKYPSHPPPSYPQPAYPKPSYPEPAYPKPAYPPPPAYPQQPSYPKPAYPAAPYAAYPPPPSYSKPSYSPHYSPKPEPYTPPIYYPSPAYKAQPYDRPIYRPVVTNPPEEIPPTTELPALRSAVVVEETAVAAAVVDTPAETVNIPEPVQEDVVAPKEEIPADEKSADVVDPPKEEAAAEAALPKGEEQADDSVSARIETTTGPVVEDSVESKSIDDPAPQQAAEPSATTVLSADSPSENDATDVPPATEVVAVAAAVVDQSAAAEEAEPAAKEAEPEATAAAAADKQDSPAETAVVDEAAKQVQSEPEESLLRIAKPEEVLVEVPEAVVEKDAEEPVKVQYPPPSPYYRRPPPPPPPAYYPQPYKPAAAPSAYRPSYPASGYPGPSTDYRKYPSYQDRYRRPYPPAHSAPSYGARLY